MDRLALFLNSPCQLYGKQNAEVAISSSWNQYEYRIFKSIIKGKYNFKTPIKLENSIYVCVYVWVFVYIIPVDTLQHQKKKKPSIYPSFMLLQVRKIYLNKMLELKGPSICWYYHAASDINVKTSPFYFIFGTVVPVFELQIARCIYTTPIHLVL